MRQAVKRKSNLVSESARFGRERLARLHESLRDYFRDLSGLSEKKLWGGLAYRYEEQLFFTLTLRPRTVLIEMKLPLREAELALGLAYVHPHGFTRLARHGWVAVSISSDENIRRVHELIDRSYWSRLEDHPRRKRTDFYSGI